MMFQSPPFLPDVNKRRPGERRIQLVALCLCGAVYFVVLGLIFQGLEKQTEQVSPVVRAVTLNFVQMELQAQPTPLPEPEPELEQEIQPEPEEADVALEKVEDELEPQPEPMLESDAPVAQVTQQASAPVLIVNPDILQGWVIEQIEQEKYYPAAAERLGLQGKFDLSVTLDETGTILSAEVLEGRGHRILRQALEKMLSKLPGQRFGRPIGEAVEFEVEFSFE